MEQKKQEKLHNRLFEDLLDLTEDYQELGTQHLVWVGISFFTQMALDCAPMNEKQTKKFVKDIITQTKKETNNDNV